ncbi:MAG: phospho-N-acetylmuramoyl-pentapeptide-transferase [Solobacterium sp.]|nr:phospho-N-acetylmuramoyl-pentapeptide-transferase [Solobacterium sp.]
MKIGLLIAFAVSLAAVLVLMPPFIDFLKRRSFRQSVSEYALADDQKKAGTPIMGGILFIVVPIIVTLLTEPASIRSLDTLTVLLAFFGYGLIGLVDDFLIVEKKNNDGLTPLQKFLMQLVLAVAFFFLYRSSASLEVSIPFMSEPLKIGWGYFILILLMFTGSSNAVNLTDGMDGLAAGCSVFSLIPFLVFMIRDGKTSIAVFIAALLGALLGYLWYNKKPARIFMGDTGSLALGGVLAALAMVSKKELLLVVIGGVFVVEAMCVMIQQVSVRTGHGKVFSYTPIHYAFRLKGIDEVKIVFGFWMAAAACAAVGLLIG